MDEVRFPFACKCGKDCNKDGNKDWELFSNVVKYAEPRFLDIDTDIVRPPPHFFHKDFDCYQEKYYCHSLKPLNRTVTIVWKEGGRPQYLGKILNKRRVRNIHFSALHEKDIVDCKKHNTVRVVLVLHEDVSEMEISVLLQNVLDASKNATVLFGFDFGAYPFVKKSLEGGLVDTYPFLQKAKELSEEDAARVQACMKHVDMDECKDDAEMTEKILRIRSKMTMQNGIHAIFDYLHLDDDADLTKWIRPAPLTNPLTGLTEKRWFIRSTYRSLIVFWYGSPVTSVDGKENMKDILANMSRRKLKLLHHREDAPSLVEKPVGVRVVLGFSSDVSIFEIETMMNNLVTVADLSGSAVTFGFDPHRLPVNVAIPKLAKHKIIHTTELRFEKIMRASCPVFADMIATLHYLTEEQTTIPDLPRYTDDCLDEAHAPNDPCITDIHQAMEKKLKNFMEVRCKKVPCGCSPQLETFQRRCLDLDMFGGKTKDQVKASLQDKFPSRKVKIIDRSNDFEQKDIIRAQVFLSDKLTDKELEPLLDMGHVHSHTTVFCKADSFFQEEMDFYDWDVLIFIHYL